MIGRIVVDLLQNDFDVVSKLQIFVGTNHWEVGSNSHDNSPEFTAIWIDVVKNEICRFPIRQTNMLQGFQGFSVIFEQLVSCARQLRRLLESVFQ